jgi:hypothetical protein
MRVRIFGHNSYESKLKEIEDRIRSTPEKAHKTNESINTLPPTEWMKTILANRHIYNEVENVSRVEEDCAEIGTYVEKALRVIGELATTQGMENKATHDTEEKLMNLTTQVIEEILRK